MKKVLKLIFILCFLFFALFIGTLVHEIIGHGLTAVFLGGGVSKVCVLFLKFDSAGLEITPCASNNNFFGWINWKFEEYGLNYKFSVIAGSLSTFIISIFSSFFILFKKRFAGFSKYVLIIFSLFSFDAVYNSLKFFVGTGDFFNIFKSNSLIIILLPIILLGFFVNLTILFYRLRNKDLNAHLKIIFSSLLFLTLFSLTLFLILFKFKV